MYYRLRFKSCPEEILFELLQEKQVQVRDVIQITKRNFKIKNARLVLFSEEAKVGSLRRLGDEEYVDSGRTYIVKRLPMIEVYDKRRKFIGSLIDSR